MTDKQSITFDYVYQRVEYYLKSVTDQNRKPVLYIANYQSIRDLQIIELDKITLLFGPNSAGKSALLDAIDDLSEVLRRKKHRSQFSGHDLFTKRMNWDALRGGDKCLVLGFGGITLSYEETDFDLRDGYYDVYSKIPQNGGYIDLLICIYQGGSQTYCYWDDGELLFQIGDDTYHGLENGTETAFFGGGKFKESLRKVDDDSESNFLWLKDAPYDRRFLDENNYALPIEFCIDRLEKAGPDAQPEPSAPLVLNIIEDFNDNELRVGKNPPYIHTKLGKILYFYLVNRPNHFRVTLIRQSRLGPLRHLPPENLAFKFNIKRLHGTMDGSYRKLLEGAKPDPLSSIEYWNKLAAELYRNTIDYKSRFTRDDVVDQVNNWISDEHLFNMGYSVSAKQEALIELPLPDDLKKIDLEGIPVQITLSLVTKQGDKVELTDVGTGISQLMPVIVACEVEPNLAIEQPELHLHPAHQLLLADLFISRLKRMADQGETGWSIETPWTIVETHSEHLILRLLRRIKESSSASSKKSEYNISNEEVGVYYFNPTDEGTTIKKLRIDEDGEFIDDWPRGFFEEGFTERFGGE